MIQSTLKQKYRETCALMTIPALEQAAENLAVQGKVEESRYIRNLIAERKAYRAEIAQETRTRPTVARTTPAEPILSPAAYHALKQCALVVTVVAAGALFVAYAIIPAFVALGDALSAIMAAAAPFIAAGVGCVFLVYLLLSGLFSKKNEYPQSSPSGGTTYITNIFVGQNGGVEVKQ